jgi:hypothetical protein
MSQDEGKTPGDAPPQQKEEDVKNSWTYEGGCYCRFIRFSVTLTPVLLQTKVLSCNCSMCTQFGYLLVCESLFLPFFLLLQHPSGEKLGQERARD